MSPSYLLQKSTSGKSTGISLHSVGLFGFNLCIITSTGEHRVGPYGWGSLSAIQRSETEGGILLLQR